MNNVKVVDLNKQISVKSEELLEKLISYQAEVQKNHAVLKKLEVDMLKAMREEKQNELEKKAVNIDEKSADAKAEQPHVKKEAAKAKEEADLEAKAPKKEEKIAAGVKAGDIKVAKNTEKPTAAETSKQKSEPPKRTISSEKSNRNETRNSTFNDKNLNYRNNSNVKRNENIRTERFSQKQDNRQSSDRSPRQFNNNRYEKRDGFTPRPQGPNNYNNARGTFNKDMNKDDDFKAQERRPVKKTRPTSNDIPVMEVKKNTSHLSKKQTNKKPEDDNRNKSRKSIIKERIFEYDDERMGSKKFKPRKEKQVIMPEPIKIDHAIISTEMVSVKTLAEKTGKPAAEIIKKLFLLGIMCTINSEIEFETAQLVCSDFGIDLELKLEKTAEDSLIDEDREDRPEELKRRPPVVTIMGHVDHGKTSLLDAIRSSRITEQEAGGITQHIGAYRIKVKDNYITFLDTPGHEAFTAMRARGAQVTDIAILVVAADDGIMPQTVEAINHAKAAEVPIIVAVNKIDKENANIDRVKQELTEHGLVSEEWGGDTIVVPVSALTHEGLDNLLDMILLVSDVQELTANPERMAKGTIIEARLDKGRGPVATVLIQNGTLNITDTVVAGTAYGRVRAMVDENGKNVKLALPSQPVEVIGFSEVPQAGDIFYAVKQSLSRQVAEERRDRQKADMLKNIAKVSLEDLFSRISEGSIKDLNIIVKADVQGSAEAVSQSLKKISNDEVQVKIIHQGVGAIQKTDVMLASAANAIIIGFNVRPDNTARETAEKENVDIRLYRIIYNAIEDIENAMKGMLKPVFEEVITGHAQVRTLFKVSNVGTIAGCYVTDGKIQRNSKVRLLRDNVVVYEGEISSLKRFKDDVKEAVSGYECGITLNNFNDIKEEDVIEAFEMREMAR